MLEVFRICWANGGAKPSGTGTGPLRGWYVCGLGGGVEVGIGGMVGSVVVAMERIELRLLLLLLLLKILGGDLIEKPDLVLQAQLPLPLPLPYPFALLLLRLSPPDVP